MQRFCPNCGDPVEPEEVFCDKCGTRVTSDDLGQNQYQTPNAYQDQYHAPTPNAYQSQYQTPIPTPNAYQDQNQFQTPASSTGQGQYTYIPGQQQNVPPYTPPPSYVPPAYNQYQKPKGGRKVLKIVLICISVVAILIVLLGIIGMLSEGKDNKTWDNETKPAASNINKPTPNDVNKPASSDTNKPTPTAAPTPTPANDSKPASGQFMVVWKSNMHAVASYVPTEKKVNVEYEVTLNNSGSCDAQNINVYIDPDPGDPNAKFLSINERTIVNYEQGVINQIGAGQSQQIKTKFYYTNVEASSATEEKLKDIAFKFVSIPLYVEWQENGKSYNARLTIMK